MLKEYNYACRVDSKERDLMLKEYDVSHWPAENVAAYEKAQRLLMEAADVLNNTPDSGWMLACIRPFGPRPDHLCEEFYAKAEAFEESYPNVEAEEDV